MQSEDEVAGKLLVVVKVLEIMFIKLTFNC